MDENIESLMARLRSTPFAFSGCYSYNGGASAREGRSFIDPVSGESMSALRNPIHNLTSPVEIRTVDTGERSTLRDPLRISLRIDIDGDQPLDVVSGSVALGDGVPGQAHPYFVGKVIASSVDDGVRRVRVGNFRFAWPGSSAVITEMSLELTGNALSGATAKASFVSEEENRRFGPYALVRDSPFFREVDVDIDTEDAGAAIPTYDTWEHDDRPQDLARETLTLESVFARAGVRIRQSSDETNKVPIDIAGPDKKWSYQELHDAMQSHWNAFRNEAQWKMWIFLAGQSDDPFLGGVMFDGEIDEPGGVDRQGTAIFTRCAHFHDLAGEYVQANPPCDAAARRELFFNLIHETGHAFNLAHSWDKNAGRQWQFPEWLEARADDKALSWMNYPDRASGTNFNASWFYRRFRFSFERSELLFLRHAPDSYVEMGGAAWFEGHGRIATIDRNPRLGLRIESPKLQEPNAEVGAPQTWRPPRAIIVEFGEPVLIDIRLTNLDAGHAARAVSVSGNLDPSDGIVEIAITDPDGVRTPFVPFDHTRTHVRMRELKPGESITKQVDLTIGTFGFPFKAPGAYRIEASFHNFDGTAASAVRQLYVRRAGSIDDQAVLNEMFDAKLGRTLYVDGTLVNHDTNERMDWIRSKLPVTHPTHNHLTAVRFKPLAESRIVVSAERAGRSGDVRQLVTEKEGEPSEFVRQIEPMLLENFATTAATMGTDWLMEISGLYVAAARGTNHAAKARTLLTSIRKLLVARNLPPDRIEERMRTLEHGEEE